MSAKLITGFKVLFVVFGLCSGWVFAQSETNKFQVDGLFGFTELKSYPALTLGLAVDHNISKFVISGQFLLTSRAALVVSDAKNYYNLDLLGGLNAGKNRFEFSMCTGIGLAFRNEAEYTKDYYHGYEESYLTVGLPIRVKIDYKVGKHMALGLIGYSNLNFKKSYAQQTV